MAGVDRVAQGDVAAVGGPGAAGRRDPAAQGRAAFRAPMNAAVPGSASIASSIPSATSSRASIV